MPVEKLASTTRLVSRVSHNDSHMAPLSTLINLLKKCLSISNLTLHKGKEGRDRGLFNMSDNNIYSNNDNTK